LRSDCKDGFFGDFGQNCVAREADCEVYEDFSNALLNRLS